MVGLSEKLEKYIKKITLLGGGAVAIGLSLTVLGGHQAISKYKLSLNERDTFKNEVQDLKAQLELLKDEEVLKSNNSESISKKLISKKLEKLKELETRAKRTKNKYREIASLAQEQEIDFKKYREYFETAIISNLNVKDQMVSVESKLREKERERKGFMDLLNQATGEMDKARQENIMNKYNYLALQKRFELLEGNYKRVHKQLIETQKSLLNHKKKNRSLEKENKKSQKVLVLIKSELNIEKNKNQKIERKLKEALIDNSEKNKQILQISKNKISSDRIHKAYESLKKEYDHTVAYNIGLTDELSELRKNLYKVGNENKALSRSNKKFEQNIKVNRSYKKRYEELKGLYTKTVKDINRLKKKNQRINKIEANYRQTLAEKKIYEGKFEKAVRDSKKKGRAIASLSVENTKMKIIKKELGKIKKQRDGLVREVTELGLASAIKYSVASSLKKNFQKHGVDVNVDMRTGEVKINFNKFYFGYGSTHLSAFMKEKLLQVFPIYAETIFNDEGISKLIKSVEIVGASSPTFNKKVINPIQANSKFYKKAMEFNLDLSYRRAKSIFKYVFHNDAIKFPHKNKMLSKIKLTGLGYLQSKKPKGRRISSLGTCKELSCSEYQVVYIRLNLKE